MCVCVYVKIKRWISFEHVMVISVCVYVYVCMCVYVCLYVCFILVTFEGKKMMDFVYASYDHICVCVCVSVYVCMCMSVCVFRT